MKAFKGYESNDNASFNENDGALFDEQNPVEEYTFKKEREGFAALWTVEATRALVEYYEELEQEVLGESKALDIAMHADWIVNHINDVMEDYSDVIAYHRGESEECIEWLREQTQVIELRNEMLLYIQF